MKVSVLFGTRPEAIKMAPLVNRMINDSSLDLSVCVSGQHSEMLDQVLNIFNIKPDCNLRSMKKGQNLNQLASTIIKRFDNYLSDFNPDVVLVHGDTTTALCGALAAFHRGIKIGHVEAGLRTHNINNPWPEEMNRVFIDQISDLLFAPTNKSKDNLVAEKVAGKVVVTGNTVIDALFDVVNMIKKSQSLRESIGKDFEFLDSFKHIITVTGHRRENFGEGLKSLTDSICKLAENKERCIVFPVHLNPNVQKHVKHELKGLDNVFLIEPLTYVPFVYLMSKSSLIISDSGGIQEEAPSLNKKVLVTRLTTERPEAVDAGCVQLVGHDVDRIIKAAEEELLRQEKRSNLDNPYGDGRACQRIIDAIKENLSCWGYYI